MHIPSDDNILLDRARHAREYACAPISGFKVGAAILCESGAIYEGCNVESATFTLTTHAEMNAIDTAIAHGDRWITKIVIILDYPTVIFPCALCRQKIKEFSRSNIDVIACTLAGTCEQKTIDELYPNSFTTFDI